MDIKALIRREVLAQKAYNAEAPSCRIKLDANENPFALSPALKDELFRVMRDTQLNRYPDAGSPRLRKLFADRYGVNREMVMLGNGSDELIQILCFALAGPGAAALVPVPAFAMYRITSLNAGFRVIEVPLDLDFDLDVDAIRQHVGNNVPALTFLGYPNNPTGKCFSRERIETIIRASGGLVVVDEAYGNFSRKTFLSLLDKYENLVVLRTLSKVGLAAMRIGLLVGSASLVRELEKVRLPYNLNSLSQVAAGFYLEHEAEFLRQAEEIIERRDDLYRKLKKIEGIRPFPSDANFILFSCVFDADSIYEKLTGRGILVKNFNAPGITRNCLRVTVGRREENEEFIQALKGAIAE
ncbi:MAG: histidinol-phosphate transaminase [Deltaproteobacteria bacterium]|nr:histidinol-phosphate transaminase [Deltaproteobacteria bacterium]